MNREVPGQQYFLRIVEKLPTSAGWISDSAPQHGIMDECFL